MDDRERDRHYRDTMKYNEFHKDGQKEDRTTTEIIEIATKLEDGATIHCHTFLWNNVELNITLDNKPDDHIRDVGLVVHNADGYAFHFSPHDTGGIQRVKDGPWRNMVDMNFADVVESFGLDDAKIVELGLVPTPGTWTGWFLMSYRGPDPKSDDQEL